MLLHTEMRFHPFDEDAAKFACFKRFILSRHANFAATSSEG